MATIFFLIDECKDALERQETTLRLRVSDNHRVQAKVKGIFVYKKYWSKAKQRQDTSRKFVKAWEEKEMTATNKILSNLKETLLQRCVEVTEENITRSWLKEQIDQILHPTKFEPKSIKPITLMEAVEDFIDHPENRLTRNGNPIKKSTQRQYTQIKNHLIAYLNSMGRTDIETDELNPQFYANFVYFLYNERELKKNTVGKMVRNLKTIIKKAVPRTQRANCEFLDSDDCKAFAEDVNNIYLTEEELQKIAELKITTPYLDRVRDQFLLLAWTGCRYSDLGKLTGKPIINKGFPTHSTKNWQRGNYTNIA